MKKIIKLDKFIAVSILSYLSIVLLSVLTNNHIGFFESFKALFATAPSNYLIYLIPIAFAVFFKNKKTTSNNNLLLFSVLILLLVLLVFFEPHYKYDALLLTSIAITSFSFILINISTLTASLILVPGIFVSKLGLCYIMSAYIPVGMLLLISHTAVPKDTTKKKNDMSNIILFVYLYIAVLAVIMKITNKSNMETQFVLPKFYHAYEYINIIAGFLLVTALMILFFVRAFKTVPQNSLKHKIPVTLYALYPMCFSFFGLFTSTISVNIKSVIITALIFYVFGNMQLDISYKENASSLVPEQLKNEGFVCLAVALFCALCFSHN